MTAVHYFLVQTQTNLVLFFLALRFEYWVMHSSIFFQKGRILSCSVGTETRPELSALITADLNEELVCGKLERSQWTLKQTSQGDSSYKSEPQQQSRASGSRSPHKHDTVFHLSAWSISRRTQCWVCVVTRHGEESGRESEGGREEGKEDEEEVVLGRESGSAGKLLLRADKSRVWK